jgi:mRNA interferase RelE/StbE
VKRPYSIDVAPRAERQFRKLSREVQVRLASKIDALAGTPRPRGVEKLEDEENLYRIRVGDYRIVYEISDEKRSIVIAKIGHRREVYRR